MSFRYPKGGFISASYNPIAVPDAPTIGTATAGAASATVAFTAPLYTGGLPITTYTATSSPGGITGTSATSPITVSGLTNGQAYTFTVTASNAVATSAPSAASNSVTPQALIAAYSWGRDLRGALGQNTNGDVQSRSSPTQIGALTDWSAASSGQFFTVAVKNNGTLWGWGDNQHGQLGQNNLTSRSSPVQIGALTTWSKVAAGEANVLAIKNDGTLWAWGMNQAGRLGLNDTVYKSSPVQVGTDTNWSLVSCGDYHSLAIKTDGTMWSWGQNGYGQLGQNDRVNRSSPVQVGALTTWSAIEGGFGASYFINSSNEIYACGLNTYGNLGQNDVVRRSSPTQIGAGTDWSKVAGGTQFALAIKTNGTLWALGGDGQNGRLGIGNVNQVSSPVQIGALTTWSKVSAIGNAGFAIKTNKTAWSWGANNFGQLGQNIAYSTARSSPVQIGAATDWSSISHGNDSSFAIGFREV